MPIVAVQLLPVVVFATIKKAFAVPQAMVMPIIPVSGVPLGSDTPVYLPEDWPPLVVGIPGNVSATTSGLPGPEELGVSNNSLLPGLPLPMNCS